MKARFTSPQHTSILLIQTDMQGMICTQKRNVEHLLGKKICINISQIEIMKFWTILTHHKTNCKLGAMLIKIFWFMKGVIEFCGMEKVSINYLISVENPGFQITDQSMDCFGLRLYLAIAVWRKAWAILVQGLRWRSCFHIHMDIPNLAFSKGDDSIILSHIEYGSMYVLSLQKLIYRYTHMHNFLLL